jgi:CubicO group peptidase (beta-lactamase class C family)
MRIIAAFVLLAAFVQAQPAPKQADVDRIFAAFNTHTPGCAVGAALHGSVVLKSGYGMADLERNVPITPDTIFESGSVAKQFTAAALLLLAQQGKISLDDPMRKYLSELPDYGMPVTIRQVLSHVSGLREWRAVGAFSGLPEDKLVYDNQDLLQLAARQRALNFEPGTDYSYTNTGFNISTILIERALGNGKTFQTFTREMIFEPLSMTHTRWRDDFRTVVPNRALSYERSKEDIWTQDTPIENIIGAGGLLTTVGDLLLWNENFSHPKVGGPELVRAQQTPATLRNGRKITYAAGLVVSSFDGLPEVSHGGATGGYRTWLGRYPDQGVSVAVLCNAASANPTRLGRETARLWTGAAAQTHASTYAADPAKSEALSGMYRKIRDNTVLELHWRNGKLTLDSERDLEPLAPGKFVSAASEREFDFEQGTPVRLRVVTQTDNILYERVEPANPTAADLSALAGEYESHETGTTLVVALDAKNVLSYRIGLNPPVTLRSTFRDSFATVSGSSIRFLRDSSGKVTAFSAGEDRVWDLRFTRVR